MIPYKPSLVFNITYNVPVELVCTNKYSNLYDSQILICCFSLIFFRQNMKHMTATDVSECVT